MNDSTERFPAAKLHANGGSISCLVFENPYVGLNRSLFWSLNLDFAPVENEGCSSITCEWIPWKFRHWLELDGATLFATSDTLVRKLQRTLLILPKLFFNKIGKSLFGFSSKSNDDMIEGSFYVCEHDPMKKVSASITHVRDNLFELEMEMVVDFNGSEYSSPEPNLLVRGKAVVPFQGLYLTQGIDLEQASEFIDISAFEPQPSKNEYGMPYYKPKLKT